MAVYAISYDPVEILGAFAAAHAIEYPLLADVGSEVITRVGVLNVTIERERAAYGRTTGERHRGLPYPGTFFLDEDGIVTGRRFEQSHRIRPTGRTLLRSLLGEEDTPPAVTAEAASNGVRVAAWLDTAVIHANQLQEVHVRIVLDDDVHLYTPPVPDGFVALAVSMSGDERLRLEPVSIDKGVEFHIEGLADTFYVLEGEVALTVPFILLSNRDTAGDPSRDLMLHVDLEYQACTAQACFMPESVQLDLALREEPNPAYESVGYSSLAALVERRLRERPRTTEELLDLVNAALHGRELSRQALDEQLEEMVADGLIGPGDGSRWEPAD